MNTYLEAGLDSMLWLACQILIVVALTQLGQGLCRRASWRQLWWRTAWMAVLVVLILELTGLGSFFASQLIPSKGSDARQISIVTHKSMPSGPADVSEPLIAPNASSWQVNATSHSDPHRVASLLSWIPLVWLVGTLVLLVVILSQRILVKRLLAKAEPLLCPVLEKQVHRLMNLLPRCPRPRLCQSRQIPDPVAWGLIHPTICLPFQFSEIHNPSEKDAMLLHELAHLAARDPLWHLLSDLLTALLWWHPAIWWMRRKLHMANELAADETSSLLPNGPETLAACLVNLGRKLSNRHSLGWLGMDGTSFRSGLGRRVTRLFTLNAVHWRPIGGTRRRTTQCISACLLILVALFMMGWIKPEAGARSTWPAHWEASTFHQTWQAVVADGPDSATKIKTQSPPGIGDTELGLTRKPATTNDQTVPLTPSALSNGASPQPTDQRQHEEKGETAGTVPDSPRLLTRFFNVDANHFMANLKATKRWSMHLSTLEQEVDAHMVGLGYRFESETNRTSLNTPKGSLKSSESSIELLHQFLMNAGVNLPSPEAIFYNDRKGMIMVRSSEEKIEQIERIIHILNAPIQEILLEVRIAEVTVLEGQELGLDLPELQNNSEIPAAGPRILAGSETTTNHAIKGVLDEAQLATLLRSLEQHPGVDLLTMPKVTSLSGRQVQIKVTDIRHFPTEVLSSQAGQSISSPIQNTEVSASGEKDRAIPQTQPVELGPVIDLISHGSADTNSIELHVITTVREFLGYDTVSNKFAISADAAQGNLAPVPIFRLRQVEGIGVIDHGETLVLGGGQVSKQVMQKSKVPILGDIPLMGKLFRREQTQTQSSQLLILITPRLVDEE